MSKTTTKQLQKMSYQFYFSSDPTCTKNQRHQQIPRNNAILIMKSTAQQLKSICIYVQSNTVFLLQQYE